MSPVKFEISLDDGYIKAIYRDSDGRRGGSFTHVEVMFVEICEGTPINPVVMSAMFCRYLKEWASDLIKEHEEA